MYRREAGKMKPAFRISDYLKMIAVYVAAVAVLYLFTISLYSASVKSLREHLVNAILLSERNFTEHFQDDIQKTKQNMTINALKQDWAILSTQRGPINSFDILQTVLHAQERMRALVESSQFVSDARAHFALWGRTISAARGLQSLDREEFDIMRMPLDATGAQFIVVDGEYCLTSVYQYKSPVTFSIVARLDRSALAESLKKLNQYGGSYTFLLRKDRCETIAVSDAGAPAGVCEALFPSLTEREGSVNIRFDGMEYLCVYCESDYLNAILVNISPSQEAFRSIGSFYTAMAVFSGILLAVMALYILYSYKVMGKPVNALVGAFRRIESGDFTVRVKVEGKSDFSFICHAFDNMAENLEMLIYENYQKEILAQRAVLKQLQTQINPHFLFNSLYMLRRFIKMGDEKNADKLAAYLGDYFKFITNNNLDDVSLASEYEHARCYADIIAMRHGREVELRFKPLPERYGGIMVPWLILQPLIENSFAYGLKGIRRRFVLSLDFREEDGYLFITVQDNGAGMDEETLRALNEKMERRDLSPEISGLVNIAHRIRMAFGDECGLFIANGAKNGTKVTLKIKRTENGNGIQDTADR